MVVTCTLMIVQTYFCFKGGESGLHLSSLHAVGSLLHSSCLAVAPLPCQQVDDPPLIQQLLAAVRLGRPAAAYRVLKGLKLSCVLLRLFAHLHLRQTSHCMHACVYLGTKQLAAAVRVGFGHKALDCVWVCSAQLALQLPSHSHTFATQPQCHRGLLNTGRVGCKDMAIAYQSRIPESTPDLQCAVRTLHEGGVNSCI